MFGSGSTVHVVSTVHWVLFTHRGLMINGDLRFSL
ncbi:hypothetical protein SLEP1_g55310 [Rubroshorea leprosula]|uniref:Uncharacterized protein n=1 Tax=Rubroshorea leprosula TaxID=152421 RepID=A0AAV5MF00_9ROSI|nr:hypothetical protein SLEP1_g55310 [Rubroshorea leprosula]